MPLQPVITTETAAANMIAQRMVQEITQLVGKVSQLRDNGVPAQPAVESRTLPDGRPIPARPAVPGVSPEAIAAALGPENVALLDSVRAALTEQLP